MNEQGRQPKIEPPIGVFEALRNGLDLTSSKLWLVAIPLVLDLILWMGPRVSLKPALEEPYEQYMAAFEAAMEDMNGDQEAVQPNERLFLDHYFLLIGIPPFLGMPSVISNTQLPREVHDLPFPIEPTTIQVTSAWGLMFTFFLSIAINIAVFSVFSVLVASSVHVETAPKDVAGWARHITLTFLQFLAALVLIAIVMFLLLFPFLLPGVLLAFVGMVGSNIPTLIASTVALIGWVLIFWLATFIVFTGHGVTLYKKNILFALWDSIRVVQWNTSATMFMLLTVIVLYVLFRLLWFTAPTDSPATLIAIIGNAFVNTGLLAATYIFYQDRHRFWEEMRTHLKEQLTIKRAQKQTKIN